MFRRVNQSDPYPQEDLGRYRRSSLASLLSSAVKRGRVIEHLADGRGELRPVGTEGFQALPPGFGNGVITAGPLAARRPAAVAR